MTKCDFCKASLSDGTCSYKNLRGSRELACEEAIKLMVKALSGNQDKKKRR